MGFFREITFKLWLPNAGIFLVAAILVANYFSGRQKDFLYERKKSELSEAANSIAGGLKLSLNGGNFSGLDTVLHYFTTGNKAISVLVFAESAEFTQSPGKLIASLPGGVDHRKLLKDTTGFLRAAAPFSVAGFGGSVYVFESADTLRDSVRSLNLSVLSLFAGFFVVSLIAFYIVALRLSTPIRELSSYAASLIPDNLSKTGYGNDGNELDQLKESLGSLKSSAEKERQRNSELMRNLETEVQHRTSELSRKNTYLEHAAKILRHDMHSGINTYLPRGINSLLRRLKPEVIEDNSLDAPIRLIKEGLAHTQKVYQGIYEFTNLVKPGSKLNLVNRNLREILVSFLSTTSYKDQVDIKELGNAMVSESLFCTAVDNLIRNGLKYNDSPTKVVRISRLEGDVIEVHDNGRGLTQEEFDRFSITGSRREGQAEAGSGLGLGICVAILQEHHFKITCQRVEPSGTSIKIKLT